MAPTRKLIFGIRNPVANLFPVAYFCARWQADRLADKQVGQKFHKNQCVMKRKRQSEQRRHIVLVLEHEFGRNNRQMKEKEYRHEEDTEVRRYGSSNT